jgi:hypothetical protein
MRDPGRMYCCPRVLGWTVARRCGAKRMRGCTGDQWPPAYPVIPFPASGGDAPVNDPSTCSRSRASPAKGLHPELTRTRPTSSHPGLAHTLRRLGHGRRTASPPACGAAPDPESDTLGLTPSPDAGLNRRACRQATHPGEPPHAPGLHRHSRLGQCQASAVPGPPGLHRYTDAVHGPHTDGGGPQTHTITWSAPARLPTALANPKHQRNRPLSPQRGCAVVRHRHRAAPQTPPGRPGLNRAPKAGSGTQSSSPRCGDVPSSRSVTSALPLASPQSGLHRTCAQRQTAAARAFPAGGGADPDCSIIAEANPTPIPASRAQPTRCPHPAGVTRPTSRAAPTPSASTPCYGGQPRMKSKRRNAPPSVPAPRGVNQIQKTPACASAPIPGQPGAAPTICSPRTPSTPPPTGRQAPGCTEQRGQPQQPTTRLPGPGAQPLQ